MSQPPKRGITIEKALQQLEEEKTIPKREEEASPKSLDSLIREKTLKQS